MKIKINLENLQKRTVVLLSIIVFILSNLIISKAPWRLDFSKSKFYSLSPSTKKILRKVDDVLKIKFYVSSNLPRRLSPLKRTVWDFLKEYKRENSNIEVYLLSPDKDEEAEKEVKEAGLPELQFSELAQDKFALSKGYFGIVVYYLDKKEVVPNATDFANLEYELSTAIYRLVNKSLPKVAVVGYENPFLQKDSPISIFHKFFTKSFQLNYVSAQNLSKDYKLLILFDDGEYKFSTDEAEKIDKFLSSGKKGLFFVDGVWVKDDLSYVSAGHNLSSLFEKRGIKIDKNLVLSSAAEVVSFGNQFVAYLLPYPFWIKTNVFNLSSNYFSNISSLTFPWASSLEIKSKNGYKVDWLVKTTEKSWEQKEPFHLLPDEISPPTAGFKQFVLVAESKKGKEDVVLFSSRRFVLNRYLSRNDNLELVSNIALSLASDGLLSGIRLKKPDLYLIPQLPAKQRELIKYVASFGLPFLYLIFGLWKVLKRR